MEIGEYTYIGLYASPETGFLVVRQYGLQYRPVYVRIGFMVK
jgi:hypothetical protein